MSKLLAPIIFVVAIAAGGGGGFVAKQMLAGDEPAAEEGGEPGEGHGDKHADDGDGDDHGKDKKAKKGKKDKKAKKGKKDKHADDSHGDDEHGEDAKKKTYAKDDDGEGGELADDVSYFKFGRQFVVPIIGENGVGSLVILDLNLELRDDAPGLYFREPKFRDALMKELLDLANEGRFEGRLTDRRNLESVRSRLYEAVEEVAGDAVKEVLILDIMRQDL